MYTYNELLKICKNAGIDPLNKGTCEHHKLLIVYWEKSPVNIETLNFPKQTTKQLSKIKELLDIVLSQKEGCNVFNPLMDLGPRGDVLNTTADTLKYWFKRGCKSAKINSNHYGFCLGDFHKIDFKEEKSMREERMQYNQELQESLLFGGVRMK
ncbi:MAG: hypothetical protein KBB75_00090 [Candidatus Pacebacteria bacterium]|jgi:hypothetical protein|nr:hypothetical protein [Candidatus Paceibacterota bacterium]